MKIFIKDEGVGISAEDQKRRSNGFVVPGMKNQGRIRFGDRALPCFGDFGLSQQPNTGRKYAGCRNDFLFCDGLRIKKAAYYQAAPFKTILGRFRACLKMAE
ncbi:hypothetical protein [Mucilaginibacter psychrotolerans]|uniref:Uncharacterized protein n=1 Tax=Mucilaginibacter psychrotolerans TaxID=1524096 RepID=A0A4Y8RZ76_9SPHI|nr:hypothetical protein [Mucilaginibacter psychrotolerans]TFF30348.1 hypothetical protein E2R66_27605 [Mucilaginibacter psychrotolerans]